MNLLAPPTEMISRLQVVGLFVLVLSPVLLVQLYLRRKKPRIALAFALIPILTMTLAMSVANPTVGGLLILGAMVFSFGSLYSPGASRRRATIEREQLRTGGGPWTAQSRGAAVSLLMVGVVLMLASIATDLFFRGRLAAEYFYGSGAIFAMLGSFRRPMVLRHFLGERPGKRANLLQIISVVVALPLGVLGETSDDPTSRAVFKSLSLVPLLVHYLTVWLPLARAAEKPALPEIPFA